MGRFQRVVATATVVALLVVCGLASPTSAVLISTDWKSYGDGLLTLDTNTGLEWLDITATSNMSLMDLMPELLDKNSELYDFKYASTRTWQNLVNPATYFSTTCDIPGECTSEESSKRGQELLDLIGVNYYEGPDARAAYGIVGEPSYVLAVYEGCLAGDCLDDLSFVVAAVGVDSLGFRTDSLGGIRPDVRFPFLGHFLYRAAQVPDAPTSILMGLGLLFLGLPAMRLGSSANRG